MSWDLEVRQTWAGNLVQPLSSTWNSGGSFTGSTGFCGSCAPGTVLGSRDAENKGCSSELKTSVGDRQWIKEAAVFLLAPSLTNIQKWTSSPCPTTISEPQNPGVIVPSSCLPLLQPWPLKSLLSRASERPPPPESRPSLRWHLLCTGRSWSCCSPHHPSLFPFSLPASQVPPGLCSSLCGLSLTPFKLCWDTPFPVSLCLSDT